MIVVEIPAALAERLEVVPVDPCATCGGDGEWEDLEVGPGAMRACGACVAPLSSLVGQRVALAWREVCEHTNITPPVYNGGNYGNYGTQTCRDCGSRRDDWTDWSGGGWRMVVGWTAEVEAVVPIVDHDDMTLRPIVLHWGQRCIYYDGELERDLPAGSLGNWSPGRYALVLRDVQRWREESLIERDLSLPYEPTPCRPFSGFAPLDEVLT